MDSDFEALFGKAGLPPSQTFDEWFAALERGLPALTEPSITLTRANFKAALRQAWNASTHC